MLKQLKHTNAFALLALASVFTACKDSPNTSRASTETSSEELTTHGYVAEAGYSVGKSLYDNSFNKFDDWVVQIQEADTQATPYAKFKDGKFDAFMPARGCTAWLKKKFQGPILISYYVKCPTETINPPEIQARDINNFWNVTDPIAEERLFDDQLYTGSFGSYHKMQGYYASTGGGAEQGNQTTRFRRYPRQNPKAENIEHIALNERDGNPDYLITPGAWHHVQLVAANGIAQYIVDEKLVYQIREGDEIVIEKSGQKPYKTTYTLDKYPAYTSGYFGLRLVRTHHIYKDLQIHQLDKN